MVQYSALWFDPCFEVNRPPRGRESKIQIRIIPLLSGNKLYNLLYTKSRYLHRDTWTIDIFDSIKLYYFVITDHSWKLPHRGRLLMRETRSPVRQGLSKGGNDPKLRVREYRHWEASAELWIDQNNIYQDQKHRNYEGICITANWENDKKLKIQIQTNLLISDFKVKSHFPN